MARTKSGRLYQGTQRLWTLAELADVAGVTADSLRQRVHRGTLQAQRLGEGAHALWVVDEATAQAVIAAGPKWAPKAQEVEP